MTKLLIIISLLLSLFLIWQWFDHCGEDVVVGETLPFCNSCSTFASVVRLMLLVGAGAVIGKIIRRGQAPTLVYTRFEYPTHEIRIHWHRIALLIAILGFPLWISWLDFWTEIPDPSEIWITRRACAKAEVKATYLWFFELVSVVSGFYFLNRSSD